MATLFSYEASKRGALEKQLEAAFDQRFESDTLKLWKRKKWMPQPDGGANVGEATFALLDGRCTFTLPVSLEEAAKLRAHLESKKAKGLEVREATADDIAENRAREVAYAVSKGPEVVSTSESASVGDAAPWEVTVLFMRDDTPPPYELLVVDGELVGFNVHARGPQRHVLAGSFEAGSTVSRTVANLPAPMATLNGMSLGPDGILYAGGALVLPGVDYTALHASSDQGLTWRVEEDPRLTSILGGTGLASTCWFEDVLFVANEEGIARRVDGAWEAVSVPTEHLPARNAMVHRYSYQAGRLTVVGGQLYFLGKGIARFDGSGFTTELAPPASRFENTVESLLATNEGTLIAGGVVLWRKALGGEWERTSDEAFGIDPDKPKPGPGILAPTVSFDGLHQVGDHIVLISNKHAPHEQIHLVRVSSDDGRTFEPVPIPTVGGALVRSSSVQDAHGGIVIAGFGGALLRVTP